MKTQTKAEMINTLKFKEAVAWEQLKDHESYCQFQNGPLKIYYADWSQVQKEIYDRFALTWVTTKNLLEALGIESYKYAERKELTEQLKQK